MTAYVGKRFGSAPTITTVLAFTRAKRFNISQKYLDYIARQSASITSGTARMISKVYTEGFRSLHKFSIDLRPGLNILVGPNGGGKTNVLSLFSFISAVASDDLGDAINSSGGASKVFRKLGKNSFSKELKVVVSGHFPHARDFYLPSSYETRLLDAGYVGLKYEWQFTIDSSLGYDEAFYSCQILKAKVLTKTLFTSNEDTWDFEIKSQSSSPQQIKWEEIVYDTDLSNLIFGKRGEETLRRMTDDDDDTIAVTLPIFFNIASPLIRNIGQDLRGGTTFNFDPGVCKQPDDSARPPFLDRNGAGLAATIYAIQKSHSNPNRRRIPFTFRRVFARESAKTLQKYFQLVNTSIGSIQAVNNTFDNKIIVHFSVDSDDHDRVDFPLELASDGTVKWLAFTVALLTQRAGFAIEEPENFLHPDIQRQAVELIRTETEGAENLHVLMTTHSETLLNAARPDELIIVSMTDGVTSAKRVDDPKAIDEEIRRTGFGLGYYYISGAIND